MAVTMMNGVFWDFTSCDSCNNRVSAYLSASIIRVTRIVELGTTLAIISNRRTLRRNTNWAKWAQKARAAVSLLQYEVAETKSKPSGNCWQLSLLGPRGSTAVPKLCTPRPLDSSDTWSQLQKRNLPKQWYETMTDDVAKCWTTENHIIFRRTTDWFLKVPWLLPVPPALTHLILCTLFTERIYVLHMTLTKRHVLFLVFAAKTYVSCEVRTEIRWVNLQAKGAVMH
jgi:hypothetical protein